jgi:lipopolysaccharide transport system ATP-binding protein
MSTTVVSAHSLCKSYRVGGSGPRSATLAEALLRRIPQLARGSRHIAGDAAGRHLFWALRDVSFDLQQGSVVGIVGRNGAGKSTLLKILSRITPPTAGHAEIHGRVGSLLEVGTGFNPDMSGRENIYFSATILGMHKREIDRQLDTIIDFADIPGFVDTPVKQYSSGMYMRLAFAVAAHLPHEILFVDEVLAVGDVSFQRKCLGKLNESAQSGRTILFVSHNMAALVALCTRALLLEHGTLTQDGPAIDIVRAFESSLTTTKSGYEEISLDDAEHSGTGKGLFRTVQLTALRSGVPADTIATGDDLTVRLHIAAIESVADQNVAIIIYDAMGYRLIDVNLALHNDFVTLRAGESADISFRLRDLLLRPGEYRLGLWMGRAGAEDTDAVSSAISFLVNPSYDDVMHSTVFPGPYQCRFLHNVQRREGTINPETMQTSSDGS